MKTFFIRVQRKKANDVRLYLKKKGLLDTEKAVIKEGNYLLFPIKTHYKDISEKIGNELSIPLTVIYREAIVKKRRPQKLDEILHDRIPSTLLSYVPKSFDIIGDICIIELDEVVRPYAKEIGDAILQLHKNVQAVFLRAGDVQGTIRVRPLKFITGEFKTETVHRENGCIFHLDVARVYFSPRLGREHWRVASQVRNSETVVDMFAGVGPYAIPAAKRVKALIYAIDINPAAYHYLQKNIIVNKLKGQIVPILGDAAAVIKEKLRHVATRVIMNLPKHAHKYLDVAFLAISNEGGIIHFYSVGREPDIFKDAIKHLNALVKKYDKKLEILYKGRVKEIAPRKWQVVLDARIS